MTQEEKFLRNVPLPEQTETYTVISHSYILDKVHEELNKHGFVIESEYFEYTKNGEVALSKIFLKTEKDPDMGMAFVWQNSYNKQVKFACAVGSFIYENNAYCIGTEGMSWLRKHTGTSDQEAHNVIEQLIEGAEGYFDKLIEEKRQMKAMPLTIEDFGCIMGALYFEHELITPNQASAIRKKYKDDEDQYTDRDTLWGLYKLLMFGIDGMDIRKWVKSQQKLHHMIMTEYLIATEVDEDNLVEDPVKLAEEMTGEKDERQEWADKVLAEGDGNEHVGPPEMYQGDSPVTAEDFKQKYIAGIDPISADSQEANQALSEIAEKTEELIPAKELSEEQIEMIEAEHGIPMEETSVIIEDENPAEPTEIVEETLVKTSVESSTHFKDNKEFYDYLVQVASSDPAMIEYYTENKFDKEKTKQENVEAFVAYTGAKIDVTKFVATESVKEEVAEEVVEIGIAPVENIDKPVEIISPEESKEKSSEFVFPVDLDNPEKLEQSFEEQEQEFLDIEQHDGIELPDDVKELAEDIDRKMEELYGEVRPYTYQEVGTDACMKTQVVIEDTLECFFL